MPKNKDVVSKSKMSLIEPNENWIDFKPGSLNYLSGTARNTDCSLTENIWNDSSSQMLTMRTGQIWATLLLFKLNTKWSMNWSKLTERIFLVFEDGFKQIWLHITDRWACSQKWVFRCLCTTTSWGYVMYSCPGIELYWYMNILPIVVSGSLVALHFWQVVIKFYSDVIQ